MYNKILDSIVYCVFKIAKMLNVDIMKLFNLVHESNMSKVCYNVNDAIETIKWYRENENRYNEPVYGEINYKDNKYYVIYDNETKKILKSVKYNAVKFD